tara:strand:+ start:220 stop:813 length:594 start_codon:yes stop_codon:yes gene_type:complete
MFAKINSVFVVFVLSILISSNVLANQPEDFIKEVTAGASSILQKNLSKDQKITELRKLADESVDISGIGMYSLGKHRKSISEEELIEYKKLFHEYFLKSFASRLAEYSDPKINVLSQKVLNEKYTIVFSVLVASEKRPEVKLDWRVYTKDPSKPLIRDLIVEGLSLVRTQKEEFNSVIQGADGDISVLFNNLKQFNE